jgi:hypothetical protein
VVKPQSSKDTNNNDNNNNTNTNKTNTSEVNLNTSDSNNNHTLITAVTMTTTTPAILPKESAPLKSAIALNTNSNANSIHLNPINAAENGSCSLSLRRVSMNVPNDYVSYTTHHIAPERSAQTTMRHHLITFPVNQ